MLYKIVLFLVCLISFCGCFEDEWNSFENSFKNTNREEIYIENVEAFHKFNFTVREWKTLNIGKICYNAGLINNSHLAIVYLKRNESLPGINFKIFNLNTPIVNFKLYHRRKNGTDFTMLITYTEEQKIELVWYSINEYTLEKVSAWSLDKKILEYQLAKMGNRNIMFALSANLRDSSYFVDIYEFTLNPVDHWFLQSIPLHESAKSMSINIADSIFYLSVPQPTLSEVRIFRYYDNHFTLFKKLPSQGADQVISFENGFKSFLAFNGLDAKIYQFRNSELVKEEIVNSNMENITYWLAVPVHTYRDETVLLAQRKLFYQSHSAFEIDVITYNGNRFEEHEDMQCNLFNETYTGLKCLMEQSSESGLIGSSYISFDDFTGLIVPKVNNASVVFKMEINIRPLEHPKKEEMDTFVKRKEKLEYLSVTGDVKTDSLNNLKFPEDYVLLNSNEDQLVISGVKTFNNIIRGYEVVSENLVNNIDLNNVVTLSGDQDIQGNITFNNIEVVSNIDIQGDIRGEEIENFLPNVGLQDTKHIISNVELKSLEIKGKLIIEKNLNNIDAREYFQSFVYQNETEVNITGIKNFTEGFTSLKNLNINSRKINNISIDSFITKDTEQELLGNTISDNVYFENIDIGGLFDGENVTELNETLLKTTENYTIYSKLLFLDDLDVNTLRFENLNNITSNNASINRNSSTNDEVVLSMDVDDLVVEGNIIGNIKHFDLNGLLDGYLHYVNNQSILQPFYIDKLTVSYIDPKNVNEIDYDNYLSYRTLIKNVTNALYEQPNITDLYVENNLNIDSINDKNFQSILNNDMLVKLSRNYSNESLLITGNCYFDSLEVLNLAGANFERYAANLIYKNETSVSIQGDLVFINGVGVNKLLEIDYLNDIELRNILRRDAKQGIVGNIVFVGNVTVPDDLKVGINVQNVDIKNVLGNINITDKLAVVKGDVVFQRLPYIKDLKINGTINDQIIEDLLNQLVYTDDDIYLEKDVIFEEPVNIDGNLAIKDDINGELLPIFEKQVVLITKDMTIEGPIKFNKIVGVFDTLKVTEALNTNKLYGQDLIKHLEDAVYIDRGRLNGTYCFNNILIHDNLFTKYLNNINMDAIVPLKTDQLIENITINEAVLTNNISVGNTVNGVDLVSERNKTAMANVEQNISSDIIFLNNIVINEMLTTPTVNNKSTLKIVTTNTDQILNATYSFNTKDFVNGNLEIDGLINGINITEWKEYSLPISSNQTEEIINNWTIKTDLDIKNLEGNGTINGMSMIQLIDDVSEKEKDRCDIEKKVISDYNSFCTDITYLHKQARNQIYKFKYFEESQAISLTENIKYVKFFTRQNKQYLLMQEEKTCVSLLLVYRENRFYNAASVHTGSIGQIELIKGEKELFLVSRGDEEMNLACKIRFSTVLWEFTENNLKFIDSIEDQQLLQASVVPLTFYGLKSDFVTEFKIRMNSEFEIQVYRKWTVNSDNADFVPRGFSTGLSLRNGNTIQHLFRDNSFIDEDFGINAEAVIIGNVTEEWNPDIPGRKDGDITAIKVGTSKAPKTMLAVARHKGTTVGHRLDLVEIYLNPFEKNRQLFDKILTYKPNSLVSIELDNGETLLAFIENNEILQLYEYKGIEGFKLRSSIKMGASKLLLMELPTESKLNPKKVLGVINGNLLTLLEAVMVGSKIHNDFKCSIS
ncbi:uncharacterized protein LOC115886340 isoform X2 [Sitophilus oryzae]|uniref:Uncharacterized protein LOC115886340 isoform X2 n=1 Tax=Sitophilus oryzae TaxID=7048 RepID=A0A6J2YBQ0_SITOR|nr:uncharacterized protein LOC115886340 isoform X2 [Sitophilus oryzae]